MTDVQRHVTTLREEGMNFWRPVCTCGDERVSPIRGYTDAVRVLPKWRAMHLRAIEVVSGYERSR